MTLPLPIRPISWFRLSASYLRAQCVTTALHITLIALGMALITAFLLVNAHIQQRFLRDATAVDAVVGAKGSPLQLVLSSVQHTDIPNGNIPLSALTTLRHHPLVKHAIPLALGDNTKGFRIVGTEKEFLTLYHANIAQGNLWQRPMDAVLGATAAHTLGLNLGDKFVGNHGLSEQGEAHTDRPYTVTGILQPTHTVIDRLILTPLQSVWNIHNDHDHEHKNEPEDTHNHADKEEDESDHAQDITAILITYTQRAAALHFPHAINRNTDFLAASPALEMTKLMHVLGMGSDTLTFIGAGIIVIAIAHIFVGLLQAVRQRQRDLAILRVLGTARTIIVRMIILESCFIASAGAILGTLLGHATINYLGHHLESVQQLGLTGRIFSPSIIPMWIAVLIAALLASLIPAWQAYKTPLDTSLKQPYE